MALRPRRFAACSVVPDPSASPPLALGPRHQRLDHMRRQIHGCRPPPQLPPLRRVRRRVLPAPGQMLGLDPCPALRTRRRHRASVNESYSRLASRTHVSQEHAGPCISIRLGQPFGHRQTRRGLSHVSAFGQRGWWTVTFIGDRPGPRRIRIRLPPRGRSRHRSRCPGCTRGLSHSRDTTWARHSSRVGRTRTGAYGPRGHARGVSCGGPHTRALVPLQHGFNLVSRQIGLAVVEVRQRLRIHLTFAWHLAAVALTGERALVCAGATRLARAEFPRH